MSHILVKVKQKIEQAMKKRATYAGPTESVGSDRNTPYLTFVFARAWTGFLSPAILQETILGGEKNAVHCNQSKTQR